MKKIQINGKEVELDLDKVCLDFYLEEEKGNLVKIDFEKLLGTVSNLSHDNINESFKQYLEYLSRWKTDAPRKRFNRQCRLNGMTVLTTDELFDRHPDGEQIIDNLENTGNVSSYLLKTLYP